MTKVLLLVVLITAVAGCAHESVDEYQEPDAKYSPPVFPKPGATLHETLSGLYAPREGDFRVMIQKIEVHRTDVNPWEVVDLSEARKNSEFGEGHSFVIIAHRICTSQIDMIRGMGANTDWFILTQNRLSAFNHQKFSFRCGNSNLFRPSRGNRIETERELEKYIQDKFPRSVQMAIAVYRRGILFARVGRIEDAELALINGDSKFDETSFGSDRSQGSKGRFSNRSHKAVTRKLLLGAIQQAKEARLNPAEDASASETIGFETRGDELARLGDEAAHRDEDRLERFEQERELRRYFETESGWMVVDDRQRRRGPAEGRVWVTYDEMQLIKAEHQGLRRVEVPPPKPLVTKEKPAAAGREELLFAKVDGQWIPVKKTHRAQGPASGEKWLNWNELQIAKMSEELSRRAKSPPDTAPATVAARQPSPEQPPRDLLVTEVDGNWRFVTEKARAAGPSDGEVWLTVAEMRKEMNKRDPGPMTAKPAAPQTIGASE